MKGEEIHISCPRSEYEASESEKEESLNGSNLASEIANDRTESRAVDIPREPVASFQTDVDASMLVCRSANANVDVHPPELHGGSRAWRIAQRDNDDFILCATCNLKTVFKHDGTAIEPAMCIPDVDADAFEIEPRGVQRGEGLKSSGSVRFALCASCMSKTVYAGTLAALYAARGHSGQRRGGERPDMRRGQGGQNTQDALWYRVEENRDVYDPIALRQRAVARSGDGDLSDVDDDSGIPFGGTDMVFL